MTPDSNDTPPPPRGPSAARSGAPPFAAALIAAGFGMATCRAGFELAATPIGHVTSRAAIVTILLLPFVVGAVVTALVYRAFMHPRRTTERPIPAVPVRPSAAPREAPSSPAVDAAPPTRAPAPHFRFPDAPGAERGSGAMATFFVICGLSAGIGALLAGMFMAGGGDGGSPAAVGGVVAGAISGAVQGGIIGLGFGLVLAIPAALAVWLFGRPR